MSDFFRTGMGHQFYQGTMPSMVTELKRLNENMEKLLALVEKLIAEKEANDERRE